jgi:hypothetical protein
LAENIHHESTCIKEERMSFKMRALIGFTALLTLPLLAALSSVPESNAADAASAQQPAAAKLKGKLKSVVGKSKTISVTVEGQGLVIIKYTDTTKLVNASSFKDLHPDEVVNVEYQEVGAEKVAMVIAKVVAELPKGVGLMTLEEAYALVQKGPQAGNYVMFDSRPASRYHEGHIPGSSSLPFADMDKAEKEGKLVSLLPPEKDKLLVFYCGGVT